MIAPAFRMPGRQPSEVGSTADDPDTSPASGPATSTAIGLTGWPSVGWGRGCQFTDRKTSDGPAVGSHVWPQTWGRLIVMPELSCQPAANSPMTGRMGLRKERLLSIVAKKVCSNGSVKDVELDCDPTDKQLVDELGGQGDLVKVGEVGQWDILTTTESEDYLIVGPPPNISDRRKKRETCTLDDELLRKQAIKGIKALIKLL